MHMATCYYFQHACAYIRYDLVANDENLTLPHMLLSSVAAILTVALTVPVDAQYDYLRPNITDKVGYISEWVTFHSETS